MHEQFGYAYDAAWNLSQRTNNALIQTFTVNSVNEVTNTTRAGTLTVAGTATEPKGGTSYWGYPPGVTNVTVNTSNAVVYLDGTFAATNFAPTNGLNVYRAIGQDTYGRLGTNSVNVNLPLTNNFSYDSNGNMLKAGTNSYAYDDENQLVSVWSTNHWREDYVYDGMNRRRIARQFTWSGSWVQTNEVRYIYDMNLVIQERDGNNIPLVTYTRGNDLGGGLQTAGGIGGLLARTDNSLFLIGDPNAHAYYNYDGNGNVTALINTNGVIVAKYNYDPFGNMISMSGPLAGANKYRFSSKEWNENPGVYYYSFRFYDPNLQRWLNRDPLGDSGSLVNQVVDITRIQENNYTDKSPSELFNIWVGINKNLYGAIGNNPVNSLDYFGLKPGDPYPTCDAAGIQAIKDTNHESIQQGAEYAGQVYKNPDGTYSYTAPNKGTKDSSDHGTVPAGKAQAGLYHTHGANDPGYDNENYSPQDKQNSDNANVPSYLGTPAGDIKKYTPDPKNPGKGSEKTIGTGCK